MYPRDQGPQNCECGIRRDLFPYYDIAWRPIVVSVEEVRNSHEPAPASPTTDIASQTDSTAEQRCPGSATVLAQYIVDGSAVYVDITYESADGGTVQRSHLDLPI